MYLDKYFIAVGLKHLHLQNSNENDHEKKTENIINECIHDILEWIK